MKIVKAVENINKIQKKIIADKVLSYFNNKVKGKKIALWGTAFKAETDDIREAPALEVINILIDAGAEFALHDPKALENTKKLLGEKQLTYHEDSYNTLYSADVLIIMTEWKEYRNPDWQRIKELMASHVIFDGRNLYDPEEMEELGFNYFGIGYGEKKL